MALLTMVELAAELGVHPNTVWKDFKRQRIPGERIGRLLRFDLQQVRQAMRERARTKPLSVNGGDARIGDSRPRERHQPPLSKTGALRAGSSKGRSRWKVRQSS